MRRLRLSLTACLLLSCLPATAAPIVYLSQNRYVNTSARLLNDYSDTTSFPSERVEATGFGVFDEFLYSQFSDPDGGGRALGVATQTSSLSSTRIAAVGSATGNYGPPVGISSAGGTSAFSVNFRIDEPVNFMLDLEVLHFERAGYSFVGPSLNIVEPYDTSFKPPVHESGVLSPGDYTFDVEISLGGIGEGAVATFDLSFVVPEPSSLAVLCVGLGLLFRVRAVQ